jgi:NAD(P)-dependent dehydrogenase (short-subunit alcohol dehydrogenase family)
MLTKGDFTMKRIALVSGANRGIGLETCKELAQLGMQVILTSRDPDQGQAALDKITDMDSKISYHQLDITDKESIDRIQNHVKEEFGRLDVLVNNAGIYLDQGMSVFDLSEDELQKTLDVNLFGAFRLSQAFIPMMQSQKYGRVINVSSGMGSLEDMGGMNAAYKISKTALNALTRVLAGELSNTNIKVNAMCPGWVRTRMGGSVAPRSLEQGVDTIIWLATLQEDGPSGGYFRDRKPIPW